jgi:hypothetical protein
MKEQKPQSEEEKQGSEEHKKVMPALDKATNKCKTISTKSSEEMEQGRCLCTPFMVLTVIMRCLDKWDLGLSVECARHDFTKFVLYQMENWDFLAVNMLHGIWTT